MPEESMGDARFSVDRFVIALSMLTGGRLAGNEIVSFGPRSSPSYSLYSILTPDASDLPAFSAPEGHLRARNGPKKRASRGLEAFFEVLVSVMESVQTSEVSETLWVSATR